MNEQSSRFWQAPERPDWLAAILDECKYMDAAAIVPLDAENLIATAKKRTGLSNFGKDESTGSGAAERFPPPKPRPTLFPVEADFLKTGFRYLVDNEIAVELPVWNSVEELLELPTSRELKNWTGC